MSVSELNQLKALFSKCCLGFIFNLHFLFKKCNRAAISVDFQSNTNNLNIQILIGFFFKSKLRTITKNISTYKLEIKVNFNSRCPISTFIVTFDDVLWYRLSKSPIVLRMTNIFILKAAHRLEKVHSNALIACEAIIIYTSKQIWRLKSIKSIT